MRCAAAVDVFKIIFHHRQRRTAEGAAQRARRALSGAIVVVACSIPGAAGCADEGYKRYIS